MACRPLEPRRKLGRAFKASAACYTNSGCSAKFQRDSSAAISGQRTSWKALAEDCRLRSLAGTLLESAFCRQKRKHCTLRVGALNDPQLSRHLLGTHEDFSAGCRHTGSGRVDSFHIKIIEPERGGRIRRLR